MQVTDVAAEQSVEAATLRLGQIDDLRARLGDLNLDLAAAEEEREGTLSLTLSLVDTTGTDRAVDLDASLPLNLEGWTWWHDINRSEPIKADAAFAEHQYPLIVVTPPDGDSGLCLAVEPSQPFIYELRASAEGLIVHAPLGLTPEGEGTVKSRAEISFYLFPTTAAWGFRDALARYYKLFPAAFERRALAEGMWLFAFPNQELPNPSHYAYHEGGPHGWQYDEEHGIGTYPYTEVSSRTIHVPRLPRDRSDALEVWRQSQADSGLALAAWSLRGGEMDEQVARTGTTSLRCSKTDPDAWLGASQDIPVNQTEPEPVVISGWLKAQEVTGDDPRECSLYGDVLLSTGEWLFGQIAGFEGGTHDWQKATWTVESEKPIAMVRLHCLFRHGHAGTVWFDDISVTTASRPQENLCPNPSFEERGSNSDVDAIAAYALHASDDQPVFSITTNFGSDVRPQTPYKLLRFTLNPSPHLRQAEGVEPPPGVKTIEKYVSMFEGIPQIDGAYIDSVSGWATRRMNFRREHFHCSRNPFSYDPESLRVVAPGRYYTYDFLKELGDRIHPGGRYVFTNIHNTMDTFLLYPVSDIPGIESSVTNHERFAYIRSASYHKPAVLLNFLNLHGFEVRSKHDQHWRLAMLYGLYPSIGRRCDEAYEVYGDLYRRFMPSLKRICAAGWEPVTHARCDPPGPYVERFGTSPDSGLFFAVLNESDDPYEGALRLDAEALALTVTPDLRAMDTVSGSMSAVTAQGQDALADIRVPTQEVVVIQVAPAEFGAETTRKELEEVVADLERLKTDLTEDQAAQVAAALPAVVSLGSRAQAEDPRSTMARILALCNDTEMTARTWTGESAGEALLRAACLVLREPIWRARSIRLEVPDAAVAGERKQVQLVADPACRPIPCAGCMVLFRDAQGVQLADSRSNWPERGYGPGLVDVIALCLNEPYGAVLRTVRLRDPIEVRIDTEASRQLAVTRAFVVKCINHSARRRNVTVELLPPDDGWQVEPGQSQVAVGASSTEHRSFRVTAPEGIARLADLTARVSSEGAEYRATGHAVCGQPQPAEPNLARVAGVQVTVDSNYGGGYKPEPLNDGLIWPTNVHWTKYAWASAEGGGDHVIEFRWPNPVTVSRVIVYWNVDSAGAYAPARLQVHAAVGEGWRQIAEVEPNPTDAATTVTFDPVETAALRIVQPAGQGSERRPNLMWVTEVQVGE